MDEYQYFFVITFTTEFGGTKQLRITGANPVLTLQDLQEPISDIITASIFDREKVGCLTNVKALVKEEVKHTVFEF